MYARQIFYQLADPTPPDPNLIDIYVYIFEVVHCSPSCLPTGFIAKDDFELWVMVGLMST